MAHPVDPGRREALKRTGALAASTLSGCACPIPSWRMGDPPPLQPGPLAPPAPREGSLALPIVIDAHCHIFNVEDVPASAMLKGPVAREFANGDPNGLITALADILSAIAHFLAPSARAELRMLEALSDEYVRTPVAATRAIERALDEQQREFSVRFAEAAQRSSFAELYAIQKKAYLDAQDSRAQALDRTDELSEQSIYERLKAGPAGVGLAVPAFDPAGSRTVVFSTYSNPVDTFDGQKGDLYILAGF